MIVSRTVDAEREAARTGEVHVQERHVGVVQERLDAVGEPLALSTVEPVIIAALS
jgi:hypothetical protein